MPLCRGGKRLAKTRTVAKALRRFKRASFFRGRRLLRNVAVDDLGHANLALFGEEVKGLRLDVGPLHLFPFKVVAGGLGVGSLLGLLSYRSDGRWAIDGLLRAGDIGDSMRSSPSGQRGALVWSGGGAARASGAGRGASFAESAWVSATTVTYCC